jgi:hypothetical protein
MENDGLVCTFFEVEVGKQVLFIHGCGESMDFV